MEKEKQEVKIFDSACPDYIGKFVDLIFNDGSPEERHKKGILSAVDASFVHIKINDATELIPIHRVIRIKIEDGLKQNVNNSNGVGDNDRKKI